MEKELTCVAALMNNLKDYITGYVGSSMLTNYQYYDVVIKRIKKCLIAQLSILIKNDIAINYEKMKDIIENSIIIEKFTDNGEHSHYDLIDKFTGGTIINNS